MNDFDLFIAALNEYVYLTEQYYLELTYDLGNKNYYHIIVGLN